MHPPLLILAPAPGVEPLDCSAFRYQSNCNSSGPYCQWIDQNVNRGMCVGPGIIGDGVVDHNRCIVEHRR